METKKRTKKFNLDWGLHALGATLILILCACFYKFVYCSLLEDKLASIQRAQQLEMLLTSADSVQSEYLSLRNELQELKKAVAETRSRLPRNIEEEEFLAQTQQAAKDVGLQIIHYHSELNENSIGLQSAEIRLTCIGSYASTCRFLEKVNQFARVIETAKLSVESDVNSDRYPVQISFVLYYGAESHDKKKG